jgi:hypothetical protein
MNAHIPTAQRAGSREQVARRPGLRLLPVPCSLLLIGLVAAAPASAQVGHDPERSPFRDIRKGSGISLGVGYLAGSAGSLGVGSTDGPTATGRFELSLGGPMIVAVGASLARLERTVLDPNIDPPPRTGPFDSDVVMVDLGLQLRLTGQKTYHRLAPYLGAAVGMAFEVSGPSDPGLYSFGTKFTVAPGGGIRVYTGRHLSLTADFRVLFWRLAYPTTYQSPPSGGPPLVPSGAKNTDWTTHPWTTVGVVWTF